MVDAAQRRRTAARLTGWTAVLVALLIWAAGFAAYVGHLAYDHSRGDRGCEYPKGSGNYGHASWQWWYPGTRCSYGPGESDHGPVAAHVDEPSWLSGAAAIALVVWPAAWCTAGVAVATRRRRRPAEDDDDADDDAWPWED